MEAEWVQEAELSNKWHKRIQKIEYSLEVPHICSFWAENLRKTINLVIYFISFCEVFDGLDMTHTQIVEHKNFIIWKMTGISEL